jgi:hypothetical protein
LVHDGINRCILVETRAKRLGVYGHCEYCDGQGDIFQSEAIEKLNNEWEPFDPPKGEGFQLWETCSEGSPVSPVFETLDDLCEWCQNNATTFGEFKTTKEKWKTMLEEDNVCHVQGNVVFL